MSEKDLQKEIAGLNEDGQGVISVPADKLLK